MTHAEKTVSHKKASIEIIKNGPYVVKNVDNFTDSQGVSISSQPVMALCRCGGSGNKPFCDGTHSSIDFKDDDT